MWTVASFPSVVSARCSVLDLFLDLPADFRLAISLRRIAFSRVKPFTFRFRLTGALEGLYPAREIPPRSSVDSSILT